MNQILDNLIQRGLVIALTPAGRGQLFSHNLYEPHELEALKNSLTGYTGDESPASSSSGSAAGYVASSRTPPTPANNQELSRLSNEVQELRKMVEDLQQRVSLLES
jgi:hypothetical protein